MNTISAGSRISRPLDVALTICQCGPRFSGSISFFLNESTFLERAPGGSHPSGGPHLAGCASFQKKKKKLKQAEIKLVQAENFERIHFTLTGIEDFASSRRRIDNLSVWQLFQRFHSTLLESDRAARGRSSNEKKDKNKLSCRTFSAARS